MNRYTQYYFERYIIAINLIKILYLDYTYSVKISIKPNLNKIDKKNLDYSLKNYVINICNHIFPLSLFNLLRSSICLFFSLSLASLSILFILFSRSFIFALLIGAMFWFVFSLFVTLSFIRSISSLSCLMSTFNCVISSFNCFISFIVSKFLTSVFVLCG